MFLLVVKGLIILIRKAKQKKKCFGVKMTYAHSTTNLLFVDDLIFFGRGTFEEWKAYKCVLDLFCSALGMIISLEKSSFLWTKFIG